MRFPILHFQKQIEHLEEFERRRLADWTFSEIKEMLLKEEIPWKNLPAKQEPEKSFPLSQILLEVPSLLTKKISRKFLLECVREKEGLKGETYRLYKITIVLDEVEIAPPYRVVIKREPTTITDPIVD